VGFINAVLRRLAAGELPRWPALEEDPVLALSVEHSHPGWLVKRWLSRYGLEETQARLAANNRIPPLIIRVNTLKTDRESLQARLAREGVDARPCRFSPVGLELTAGAESPAGLPSYREGLWLFQDEAAQLVSLLLPVKPGQKVVEMGAGRGGKTSHLAEALDNQGLLLAVDNHRGRLGELSRTLRRWGVTIGRPLLADAAGALPVKPGRMDAVVVDAPCSGLGILRRHPEMKSRIKEDDLPTFPPRQRTMLENAAALLKPGGYLLYITCTTEPEENEALVAAFLADHPDFHPATDPGLLPPAARPLISPAGCFATSPAAQNLDGFFAVVFNRR
jgi:16S rRNA (cytosine967-C5)-methyltransferase